MQTSTPAEVLLLLLLLVVVVGIGVVVVTVVFACRASRRSIRVVSLQ